LPGLRSASRPPEQITGRAAKSDVSQSAHHSREQQQDLLISDFSAAFSSVLVGVSTTTDLLGGGDLNQPISRSSFGSVRRVAATKSFSAEIRHHLG
jgi:hypothetical protein